MVVGFLSRVVGTDGGGFWCWVVEEFMESCCLRWTCLGPESPEFWFARVCMFVAACWRAAGHWWGVTRPVVLVAATPFVAAAARGLSARERAHQVTTLR